MMKKRIKTYLKFISGWILYNFLPRKEPIIILSCMRSGSTLLKALLSEVDEIEHINEYNFNTSTNGKVSYFHFYFISKKKVILKYPSGYKDYYNYPQLPKYSHKKVILIRNPIDSILSMIEMNKQLNKFETSDYLIKYWTETYKNLLKYKSEAYIVRYEDIINQPVQSTQSIFKFMGFDKDGTSTYSKPISGKWIWGIDDGSTLIKKRRVIKIIKNYSPHMGTIQKINESEIIKQLVIIYDLKLPQIVST